jgi:hypothetical protein
VYLQLPNFQEKFFKFRGKAIDKSQRCCHYISAKGKKSTRRREKMKSHVPVAQELFGELQVFSPYSAEFVRRARQLGGRWDRVQRCWIFDPRVKDLVSKTLLEIYGADGFTEPRLFNVTVKLRGKLQTDYLWGFGRMLLSKPHRDVRPRCGDSVVLVEGQFQQRGGSARYPEIGSVEGVVLRILDVPEAALERERSRASALFEILEVVGA